MIRESIDEQAPQGLGGWLALWGFGMIMTVIFFAVQFVQAIQADSSFDIVFSAILIAVTFYLIYLYFAKKQAFPKLAITLISLNLLLCIFDFLTEPDTLRDLVRGFGQAVIWIPYLMISKRVKATFINPGLWPSQKASPPAMETKRHVSERQIIQ